MLNQRATEPELLDRLDTAGREVERSLWFCAVANRYFGGTRVARKLLRTELARLPGDRPLRVLDIGAGDASITLALSRWAAGQGREIRFVCLERHPHAARLAREAVAAANDSRVRVIEGDVLTHQPDQPYDYALGSLFFHHLADDELVAMLERLRTFVRRGVLVNDLRRCGSCYRLWHAISWLFTPVVRHDLLLSIRRGFRPSELRRVLGRVNGGVSVSVTRCWFCRLAGVICFE
jgi:predicted O-methyltransferase YrrM